VTRKFHGSTHLSVLAALASLLLTACGGGSGENPAPTEPTVPTAEDVANARSSELNMVLAAQTRELTVSWTDTFAAEKSYKIQRRADSGQWETVQTLAASPDTGSPYSWTEVIDQSAHYRVIARRDGYSVPLEAASGVSEISIDLPAEDMTIELDRPEPLKGVVRLTVTNVGEAESTQYFADLQRFATSTDGPSFPATWDSQTLPDGEHLLIARVEKAPGSFLDLRRAVVLDNPNVAISLRFVQEDAEVFRLIATATAEAGVASVEFFLDGDPVAPVIHLSPLRDWWYFLDTHSLPGGPITVKAVATDTAGDSASIEKEFVVDNLPVLQVNSPLVSAIVKDELQVQGTFSDDSAGTELIVYFGQLEILRTSASPFHVTYSLDGLPAGSYPVTVQARGAENRTTVRRKVVVTTTNHDFELVDSSHFPASASHIDNGSLLFTKESNGALAVRDAAGHEVELEAVPGIRGPMQLNGGRVAMSTVSPAAIFLFDATGAARNISDEVSPGGAVEHFTDVELRGSWLAWNSTTGPVIYNVDTSEFFEVPLPAGAVGFTGGFSFSPAPGNERLFFSARIDEVGETNFTDTFAYLVADGTTEALSSEGALQSAPQTDGDRVAWSNRGEPYETAPPYQLFAASATNPTTSSMVSEDMNTNSFELRDGLLAWTEFGMLVRELKVDDGSTTQTLSSVSSGSPTLYTVADGHVIFGESGKLYVWSAALGRLLLLETLPASVIQDGGVAFLQMPGQLGERTALYRVELP
jgi:hypothetical protein